MRYDLDQLDTFLTVMELGTVTAAAARLNLSKSVVSKRITDLEAELGVALFRRNAGRIAATEAGTRLAERVRPVLADLRAVTEGAALSGAEALRGNLAIAVPMSLGTMHLSPLLASFAARHPALALRVDYDDRSRDLVREGFDIAIRVGRLRDSALMVRRLYDDCAIPCAAPAFLDHHGRPSAPRDLAGLPAIGYSHVANGELWQFGSNSDRSSLVLNEVVTLNNGEAMRDMAIAGLGIAVLPGFIAQPAIASGLLEALLPDQPRRDLPISVVWPPVQPMPAKLRALIDHLTAAFAQGAPWTGADGY